MKGCNGLEIRTGCLLFFPLKAKYRRVDFIIGSTYTCVCGFGWTDKAAALNTDTSGNTWTHTEIMARGVIVCMYKPLGIYDKDGKEIHDQDEVKVELLTCATKYKVFGGIKARNESKRNFVMLEDNQQLCGWRMLPTRSVKICSRPTDKKEERRNKMEGINGLEIANDVEIMAAMEQYQGAKMSRRKLCKIIAERLRVTRSLNSMEDKIRVIKNLWNRYKEFLKHKYPTKEGIKWEFTCPYHKKIDEILNQKKNKEEQDERL